MSRNEIHNYRPRDYNSADSDWIERAFTFGYYLKMLQCER